MARIVIWSLVGLIAVLFTAQASYPQRPRQVDPPVIVAIPEGGQLICDPFDGAAAYQPTSGDIWALNSEARQRIGRGRWTGIPLTARANLDPQVFDSLRRRAESLCN